MSNPAYLEVRLSGGAGNSNPALSLGGVKSSSIVGSQTPGVLSTLTGVSIIFATGMGATNNVLEYNQVAGTIRCKSNLYANYGDPVDVSAGGRFWLEGGSPYIGVFINVITGLLPGTNVTDYFTASDILNNLVDDISRAQAISGHTDYRCVYLHNAHPTDTLYAAQVWQQQASALGLVTSLGLGGATGDGSSTGVAVTIGDEATAPSGVSFAAATQGSPLVIGDLAPGQSRAVWVRRVSPPGLTGGVLNDSIGLVVQSAF